MEGVSIAEATPADETVRKLMNRIYDLQARILELERQVRELNPGLPPVPSNPDW